MRIVLDTNIFISGLIKPNSIAGKVIGEWKSNSIELITSIELLNEIKKVLEYPKINKIIKWDTEAIKDYIDYLYFLTTVVDIGGVEYHFDKDPNDNHVICTYIAGKCDWLVTGDKALLEINRRVNVISLEQFVKKFFFE